MIIGLTGANASGKGEAAAYLRSKGFEYYSLSDILRQEARKKRMDLSRENLIKLGNELREKNGPGILAELTVKNIKFGKDYVIDSIRNPFEIKALGRLKGFTLIGIDAPVDIRFKRALARKRPGDPETLEGFIEKEGKENLSSSTNQQLDNCLKAADKILLNDSTIKEFHRRIDDVIRAISNK